MKKVDRLCALTDGVYAIAITLLIFSVTLNHSQTVFNEAAAKELLYHIIMYAIGFIGIAVLWFSNHRTYSHIVRYRSRLGTLTMVHLFFVVLIPAMTSITIHYEGQVLPNLFYIGAYLGAMLTQSVTLAYLYKHKLLEGIRGMRKEEVYDAAHQWIMNAVVCGAVVFVFLSPWASVAILVGGMIVATIVQNHFNKKYHYIDDEDNSGGEEPEVTISQEQIDGLIKKLQGLQKEKK